MIRAEKSTPNENAFRTLIMGTIGCVLILLGFDPAVRLYDRYIRPLPWIEAKLEILKERDETRPLIRYEVTTTVAVEGEWVAWVESENGIRLCGSRGRGSYDLPTRIIDGARAPGRSSVWDWKEWIGADCYVPVIPFRVCVQYPVRTVASQVPRTFGPYCSPIYDPRSAK
jgi:hypothetical protein